jgi:hypothetical protein
VEGSEERVGPGIETRGTNVGSSGGSRRGIGFRTRERGLRGGESGERRSDGSGVNCTSWTILLKVSSTAADITLLLGGGRTGVSCVRFARGSVPAFSAVIDATTVLQGITDVVIAEETGEFGSR